MKITIKLSETTVIYSKKAPQNAVLSCYKYLSNKDNQLKV